jgi:hypothetical protein
VSEAEGTEPNDRGEVTLRLDGTDYVLRPTFEACVAVERQIGRSIIHLAAEADAQRLTVEDMSIVAAEFIRAWGKETETPSIAGVKAENIAPLIFAEGVIGVAPRLAIALIGAITGGMKPTSKETDDAGEPKAAIE